MDKEKFRIDKTLVCFLLSLIWRLCESRRVARESLSSNWNQQQCCGREAVKSTLPDSHREFQENKTFFLKPSEESWSQQSKQPCYADKLKVSFFGASKNAVLNERLKAHKCTKRASKCVCWIVTCHHVSNGTTWSSSVATLLISQKASPQQLGT